MHVVSDEALTEALAVPAGQGEAAYVVPGQ